MVNSTVSDELHMISRHPCPENQRHTTSGFSMVELMVAITIGLIIMAAVSTIFVGSKRSYSTQDRLARLQENARFAVHYLTRDLRMAGYSGCLDDIINVNNTLNSGFTYNASFGLDGLENATGKWYPSDITSIPAGIKSGTDALTIRMADPSSSISISKAMPNTSAELDVTSVTGVNINDIIMVSDCSNADVMQITQVQTSSVKLQHNAGSGTPGNSTQKLSKQYKPPAKVFKFKTRLYYIKEKSDADNTPTLYVSDNGVESELVEGIEDLQVTYGVDTDTPEDSVPNVYMTAGFTGLQTSLEWARVKTVRIGILARTPNSKDIDTDINTSYDVNGKTVSVASGDKYQRRVFTMTVQLRNY